MKIMKTKIAILMSLMFALVMGAHANTTIVDGGALGPLQVNGDFLFTGSSGVLTLSVANENTLANSVSAVTVTTGTSNSASITSGTLAITVSAGFPIMTSNSTATATFNTSNSSETIYNTSGSLLGAVTITLPATSSPGQMLRYVTKSGVTVVTVTGNLSIGTQPTILGVGGSVAWQCTTSGTFARIQ